MRGSVGVVRRCWRIRGAEVTVGSLLAMIEETSMPESGEEPRSSFKSLRQDFVVLTKARLSVLVVLTAAFGYVVATKSAEAFSWSPFLHMLFGTTLAAFGASVFNQLMEVEADAKMRRTSDRPLPANRLPKPLAFILGWLLCAFGLIHLGVKVNMLSAAMAAATLLTYLFIYTPLKQVSSSNTIVGAVSGAIPPLIGWAAGGQPLLGWGAAFLFGLLFFWQLPHFAAINWMYREEYMRGGFVMWSNDDVSGAKTGKIGLLSAALTVLLCIGFSIFTPVMGIWGGVVLGIPGVILFLLAYRFLKSGERSDAKKLFLYTLIYLPIVMIGSYLVWR